MLRSIPTITSLLLALTVAPACTEKEEPARTEAPAEAAEAEAPAEPEPAAAPGAEPPRIDIPNARVVGDVLTGGQPTPEDLRAAKEAGYAAVISLQTSGEEGVGALQEAAEEIDLPYHAIEVAGADDVTAERARELHETLAEVGRPVIVHCGSGNRVGALFALRAHQLEGKTPEEALAIGKQIGLTEALEPVVRERLGIVD